MRCTRPLLVLAVVLGSSVAAAAATVAAHRAQAAACRAAFLRASATARDEPGRAGALAREEDCLVQTNDALLPALSQALSRTIVDGSDELDAPTTTQTYRDASSGFCAVLTEKSGSLDAPRSAERAQCTADRESELARLVDEYAAGGGGATAITSGTSSCDESLKAARSGGDFGPWTTFVGCATAQANAKVSAFVPKAADGDPLGALGHSPEQIAMTLSKTFDAGKAVCDVLAATHAGATEREPVRARCRAAAAANVSKAVAEHAR
jgi:hypothetical protein